LRSRGNLGLVAGPRLTDPVVLIGPGRRTTSSTLASLPLRAPLLIALGGLISFSLPSGLGQPHSIHALGITAPSLASLDHRPLTLTRPMLLLPHLFLASSTTLGNLLQRRLNPLAATGTVTDLLGQLITTLIRTEQDVLGLIVVGDPAHELLGLPT